MSCQYCGAPITLSRDAPTICSYCGRSNDPPPKEVQVPVPVQVVQNVVNVVGAPPAELRELRCPHCRKRLVTARAKDVDLSGCPGCGGIWIDNASSRRVLADPEPIFGELARRAGDNATNRRTRAQAPGCPECTAVLDKVKTHGIELDVCAEHGTWFDAFEMGTLVRALREPAGFHPGDARMIKCAVCQRELTADRANVTDHGLTCDGCWRGEQTAEQVAADQQMNERGAIAVGGVLLGVAAAMLGAAAGSKG